MFQGKNLTYQIANKKILDEVSVAVFPGKFTGIVGPNGAGKSTLLKLLSGDQQAVGGTIHLNGKVLGLHSPAELALKRAVLPQKTQVSLAFTAWEVVSLGRSPHKRSARAENNEAVCLVMKEADVWHLKDRIFQTLSGGEQQRVHLARVLAQLYADHKDPVYLLLDEPTSSLDIAQQHGLLDIVKRRCTESGYGVAAVIHDLNLAAQYADYLLFMKAGQETGQGPASMVLTKDMIEYTFGHPVDLLSVSGSDVPFVYSRPAKAELNESLFEKNIKHQVNGKFNG